MKYTITTFLIILSVIVKSQPEFEGSYAYKSEVSSLSKDISMQSVKNILLVNDSTVGWYKKGNEKQVSERLQVITIPAKKRVYVVFKGIDSLYYRDFDSGLGNPENIQKDASVKKVNGIDCENISYTLSGEQKKIYYAPSLYINPEHSRENKIGANNILGKEMRGFRVETITSGATYKLVESCYRIKAEPIDDKMFELPNLPETKLDFQKLVVPAEFPGKEQGWNRYIQNNLKGDLAVKYVKIKKNESSASQQAIVEFYVSDEGRPVHILVTNKDEVHPKLAEEAMRVIRECPNWKPATLVGRKIAFFFRMPITFLVTK